MVTQSQKKTDSSDSLISPNCCFTCDDFDLSTLFSWTGFTDSTKKNMEAEDIEWRPNLSMPKNPSGPNEAQDRKNTQWHRQQAQYRYQAPRRTKSKGGDHPPPVIALSRSSFSNVSTSSAESALETTEVDRLQDARELRKNSSALSRSCGYGDNNKRSEKKRNEKLTRGNNVSAVDQSSLDHDMEYSARHELLINALFEDAKDRQELSAAMNDSTANNSTGGNSASSCITPPRPTRNLRRPDTPGGTASISVISRTSFTSRRSSNSCGSDILSPSSHRFKKSLKMKRKCKHQSIEALKQYQSKSRRRLSCADSGPERTNEDLSCTSSTTLSNGRSRGDLANSFLHSKCLLQKDSGKGVDPGTGISASGRESAMAKLIEKMDLLAEVEHEGSFSNAVLTRVQAKNMTQSRRDLNFGFDPLHESGFVETRSMLAVKMGFVSLKYGIMVHWNKSTGLAELIVLRKMCPDSFMKAKSLQKSKSWRRRKNAVLPTSSIITLNSSNTSCDTYHGLELEAV